MVRLNRPLCTILLSLVCASAPAQQNMDHEEAVWRPFRPHPSAQGRRHIKSLLDDAGLSGRFVFYVDFDREGNAWIASSEGLYFYDGYTWTRFSVSDGLPSNFVRSLNVARDGTVWVGTNKGIATVGVDGRISIPENSGLAGPNVRRIVEDDDGTLWFCSDTWLKPNIASGLAELRDGRWTVYREEDGLPGDYVSDYFRDASGRQYALCRNGLAVKDGERWIRPLEAEGFPNHDDYFWSITESESVGVLTTTDDAVFVFKDSRWRRYDYDKPMLGHLKVTTLASGEIVALANGQGSAKHLVRWDGSGFVQVTDSLHVPGEATHLTVALDGSVWCAGYNLLLRWSPARDEWIEYPDISAPQLVDDDGRVWFTADGAVVRLTGDDHWEAFPGNVTRIVSGRNGEVVGLSAHTVIRFVFDDVIYHGPDQTGVFSIAGHVLDAVERSWIYGQGEDQENVVSVFDGVGWSARTLAGLEGARFHGTAADRSGGAYYLICDRPNEFQRLYHVDALGIESIELPDVAMGYVPGIHVDYRGELWIYGHFGLFAHVDGAWRHVEGIPGERIFGAVNADGETWITYDGTAGGRTGVGRLRDGTWSHMDLPVRPALCGRNPDAAILFHALGHLFRGVDESGAALLPLHLPVKRFVKGALQGAGSDLWVGVGDSVLRYRPDGVPPQTIIVEADQEVPEGGSLALRLRGVERFQPRGESAFTYSWRFAGGPWSEFGPAQDRVLPVSLGPGRYAIEVRARDEGLDVDPTPARAEFRVTPIPLVQRAWFWPIVGLTFIGLAALGGMAVVARNRTRHQAVQLEQLVGERTAKLRESEARFRAMTAAAPIPILICRESDGVILYANPLLGETLGVPSGELLGRHAYEFFGDRAQRRRLLDAVQVTGYVQGHEVLTRKADGSEVWSLVSFQRMVYDGQPALIGGMHDITERKHAAEEMERARSEAELASRTKSVFLANLTHEVRTPIMAMLSAAEASAARSHDGKDGLNHAQIISRNGRHLLSLFDNLLDLACLDAGKFNTRSVRCSLVEVLADVRAVAHPLREKRGVDFRLSCETAIPSFIQTDPVRLKQALINLIGNALKFTTSGHVHVRVCVDAEGEEPRLSIAVQDTGPGLRDAELQRIFDPFEQVEPRRGQPFEGVGLGLPLARRIAEELGGTVLVESRLGVGSTFTLRVATGSLSEAEWLTPETVDAALESPDPDRDISSQRRIEGSVLLAEDTEDTRALISIALGSAGAEVTIVTNGREAVEAASKRVYDLVLMDIRMPVMDGRAAMTELRARGYLAPIIALTASVGKGDHQQLLDDGFDDLWPKPISLERIIERAGDYMRSPGGDDQGESRPSSDPVRATVNEARLASVKAEFARGLPRRLEALQSAVASGDTLAAREILHQLAGTAGIMDFMSLSVEARRVLQEVKKNNHLDAAIVLRPLQTLVEDITRNNGGHDSSVPPQV